MPNPSDLLAAFYVIGISTVVGVAYAILIQPGELLSFVPGSVATVLRSKVGDQVFKKIFKLFTCGKCIAGQFSLWSFPFIVGLELSPVLLLYLATVCASIVITSITLIYVGSNS